MRPTILAGRTAGQETRLPPPLPDYLVDDPGPWPSTPGPIKVAGLHLHLVETDEGTLFVVLGRGEPVSTLSHTAACAELEARLDGPERRFLEGSRWTVRDIVPAHTYDRMHGWGGAAVQPTRRFRPKWLPQPQPRRRAIAPPVAPLLERLVSVMGRRRVEQAIDTLSNPKEDQAA